MEKLTDLQIDKLKSWACERFKIESDIFDFNAEVDRTLNFSEAQNNLREKLKVFFKEEPTNAEIKTQIEQDEYLEVQEVIKQEEEYKTSFDLFIYELKKNPIINISKYDIPKEYIRSVARGYNKGFIFLGDCGNGKTYLTRQILAQEKIKFIESRGVSSPLALYNFLYEHKDNETLLFDDVAGLINNPNSFSILLGALWDGFISWNTTSEKLNIPKSFIFNSRIIIISNVLKGQDIEVLKSRALIYNLHLNREEKLKVMFSIARQKHEHLTKEQREQIVNFIVKNTDDSSIFDLRTQQKAEQLYLYNSNKWEELVKPLIFNNDDMSIFMSSIKSSKSITEAEKQFMRESGKSRSTFYNLKRSLNK